MGRDEGVTVWTWAEAQRRLIGKHKATLQTGLDVVDRIATGLGPGETWLVVGERCLVTDMAVQLLSTVVGNGLPATIYAAEHPPEDIWRWLVARWAAVPMRELFTSPSDRTVRRMAWLEATLPGLPITVVEADEPELALDTVARTRLIVLDGFRDVVDAEFARTFRSTVRASGATSAICIYDRSQIVPWREQVDTVLHLRSPKGPDADDRAGEVDLRVISYRNALRTASHWPLDYRPEAGPAFRSPVGDAGGRPNLGLLDPRNPRDEQGQLMLSTLPSG